MGRGIIPILLIGVAVVLASYQLRDLGPHSVEDLPLRTVQIDGRSVTLRVAETEKARAQGFQRATPDELRTELIYFAFPEPSRPVFHMHNVSGPLRIAWISPENRVIGVDTMAADSCCGIPPDPVIAALEYAPNNPLAATIRAGVTVVPSDTAPSSQAAPATDTTGK
jgi:uncharacterized membrane protein (UPF0127 family)